MTTTFNDLTEPGRSLALGPIDVREVEDRKGGGMAAEAVLISKAIPASAAVIALDERGKIKSSPDFANDLARFRDDGRSDLAFIIGGADGIDPSLRAKCDASLSFGKCLATYVGACDACRTALSCCINSRWRTVSPRLGGLPRRAGPLEDVEPWRD